MDKKNKINLINFLSRYNIGKIHLISTRLTEIENLDIENVIKLKQELSVY